MLPISSLAGIISQSGTQVVIAPGTPVTTLQVRATGAGTFPYSATVLPLEGQVPTGSTLQCVEDTTMRACILSTHQDGSAAVVVVSGTTTVSLNQTKTLSLQTATIVGETNLNASRISSLLTDISLNFGSPYGTATISDFSSPERIWWATPTTICARYRIQPPTLSGTQLEAVIDVHAYASSTNALVEIVVENCKMNTASPSAPSAASYTSAVLTINGNTITTVNGNGAPEGYHAPFRSWYSSSWLQGDPGLRITQLYTDLQKHPLLYKMDQASTVDMAGYAGDAYSPWATGRQRPTYMGGGGDHPSIGPLPQWEARTLQTGDYRGWVAVEASALACLGYNINYRDSTTGLTPTFTQLKVHNVSQNGYNPGAPEYWPHISGPNSDDMGWDAPHHPAAGLMAFISRPSPVYIELAQKVAVWNGTWSVVTGGPVVTTGVFGPPYNIRGRAWCMRSLGHATFLTPDALPWKGAGKSSINDNVAYLGAWTTDSKAVLNAVWDESPSNPLDGYGTPGGFGQALWMQHYLITEVHKVASINILSGSAQTALSNLADWVSLQPVRWVNEQSNGGWRFIPYVTVMGRTQGSINSLPDWGQQMAYWMTDTPPSVSGTWRNLNQFGKLYMTDSYDDTSAGALYPSYFWSALVAAYERGVTGVDTAMATVLQNVTNFSSWRAGFASDPRWGPWPRNYVQAGFGTESGAGTFASDVWTPGVDSSGVVNHASWDLVPTGRWVSITGSELSQLDAEVRAGQPSWSTTQLAWGNIFQSWSGFCPDVARGRWWFFGGGHSDGFNNGLYRFDVYKMKWAIEHLPSDRTNWSTAYSGSTSSTVCPESAGQTAVSPVNDWYYDELYWSNPTITGISNGEVGEPTSRHTYSSMVYNSTTNEIYMVCRRLWRFALSTGKWIYKRQINDGVVVMEQGEHLLSTYDEVSKKVIISANGSSGMPNTLNYDTVSEAWVGGYYMPWSNYGGVVDCRDGRTITAVYQGKQGNYANDPYYWTFNLDTGTGIGRTTMQYGGGASRASFIGTDDTNDGGALCYISSINKYWMLSQMPGYVQGWFEVNPATTPWTISPLTFVNSAPAINPLLNRRLMYVPSINAVIVQNQANQTAYIYKF